MYHFHYRFIQFIQKPFDVLQLYVFSQLIYFSIDVCNRHIATEAQPDIMQRKAQSCSSLNNKSLFLMLIRKMVKQVEEWEIHRLRKIHKTCSDICCWRIHRAFWMMKSNTDDEMIIFSLCLCHNWIALLAVYLQVYDCVSVYCVIMKQCSTILLLIWLPSTFSIFIQKLHWKHLAKLFPCRWI